MQAVRAAFVFLAPALDEFAVGIEDENGIVATAAFADGLFDDDLTERVFDDAVRVAEGAKIRDAGPIVNDFILVFARADDGKARTGFVRSANGGSKRHAGGGDAQ